MFATVCDPVEGEVTELPLERLEAELLSMAARSNAALCRWLRAVAEFDRRQGYASWEVPSASAWIAWKCGVDGRTARDYVRVARSLAALPAVTAAFSTGQLPYSKVRALTRIATAATEAELVELACRTTTAQLERVVRATRSAIQEEQSEEEGPSGSPSPDGDRTFVDAAFDDEGYLRVSARLPAAGGAVFAAALDQQLDLLVEEWKAGGGSREPDSCRPRRSDALVAMAEASLSSRSDGPDDDRYLVVVHVEPDGSGHLDDGPPLPPAVLDEVVCGQPAEVLVEDAHGNPLWMGRKTRVPTRRQRRALAIRAGNRCEVPGCETRRFLHAHHVRWWSEGGATDIDNMVLLCGRHHRALHRGHLSIERSIERSRHGFRWFLGDAGRTELLPGESLPMTDLNDIPPPAVLEPAGGDGERMNLDRTVTAVLCHVLGHPPR